MLFWEFRPNFGITLNFQAMDGLNEFTPETTGLPPTNEQQKAEATRKKYAEYAAAADREISRIAYEHGVRLGDSIIAEQSLCESVTDALKIARDKYLKLSQS